MRLIFLCTLLLTWGWISVSTLPAQSVADKNRMAAGYYSRGQWQLAATSFQKLIDEHPTSDESSDAYFFLGESQMQLGEYQHAYRAYQVFLQRNPEHRFLARATFRMGEAAYRLEQFDRSLRMLEVYVRNHPHDALNEFALAYIGEIRLKRAEPQLAQKAFETALKLYPNSRLSNKCRFGLAKAFQNQSADENAVRLFSMIANDPGNPLSGASHLQLAKIHLASDDVQAAQGHLLFAREKIQKPELKSEAVWWLARTYVAEENFERAFDLLETGNQDEGPDSLAPSMLYDGAVAAIKLNRQQVAVEWLTQLVSQYPKHELADDALHLQIDLARDSSDSTQLNALVDQFVESFPHSRLKPDVLETKGRDLYSQEKYSESVEVFEQLLTDDLHLVDADASHDRANWRYLKAIGQLGLNECEAAEQTLEKIELSATSAEMRPLANLALATARFGQQEFQSAIPNYEKFLDATDDGPKADRARIELIICLAETRQWSESEAEFENLKRTHPDPALILETAEFLAEKSNREDQFEQAVRWYEFLANPEHPLDVAAKGLSGLGWIKMDLGDTKAAMMAFQRLIDECPDSQFTAAAAMARAKHFEDIGDHPRAAELYGIVVRRFAEEDMANVARLRRAYALQKSGEPGDLLEARTLLTEYLELPDSTPARDEALYQLAWVNQDLEQTEASIQAFQQLVQQHPQSKYQPDAALRVAKHLASNQKFAEAAELAKSLAETKSTPDVIASRAIYLTGDIAAQQQKWNEVIPVMRRLLQQSNDPLLNNKANYWLAEALYREQDITSATMIFQSLSQNSEGLESALLPWVALRHAQCLGQQGAWAKALEVAQSGKQCWPEFVADYEFDFVRARALEDAGKLDDARKTYQAVIDSPRGGETETAAIAQWRIAETWFHSEEYSEAIDAYYKVDSLFAYQEWRSASMFQAGKCQEHLGNWQHAEKLYTRLIQEFPDCRYANAAQQRLDRVVQMAKVKQETETR